MPRALRLSILALALSIPSFAFAGPGGADGESRGECVNFVAVVDALDLPNELAETLELLDAEGPVLVATVFGRADFEDFFLRFDVDLSEMGPLASFEELTLIDSAYAGMPAVMTDRLDPQSLAVALAPEMEWSALRSVIDTAFLDESALRALPESYADSDWTVGLGDNSDDLVPSAGIPGFDNIRFADPSAVPVGFMEELMTDVREDDWQGVLCAGVESSSDECIVADDLTGPAWVLWAVGGPEDEVDEDDVPAGSGSDAADDEETEETVGSGSSDDSSSDTAPEEDEAPTDEAPETSNEIPETSTDEPAPETAEDNAGPGDRAIGGSNF